MQMKIFILRSSDIVINCIKFIRDLPSNKLYTVLVQEYSEPRKKTQNAYQWAGMMNDFVKQGIIDGRQFSSKVWHEYLKELHLPEQPCEGITLKGYQKWTERPDGKLVLTGSTTKLTVKGMSEYLTQCQAWGSQELGIKFTTKNYVRT